MRTLLLSLLLLTPSLLLGESAIFKAKVDAPVDEIYDKVTTALEDERLWVVFEANIGKNIAGFADKWGENYNRNKLDDIRSIVFCNGWYANEVSNKDPDMLALCPLKITLTEKAGVTTALFVKPTAIAGDSPATEVLGELEERIKTALEAAGFTAEK